MIRWQYKSYVFEPGDKVLERLNSLGNDGWELMFLRDHPDGRTRAYFKRPIVQPETGEQK